MTTDENIKDPLPATAVKEPKVKLQKLASVLNRLRRIAKRVFACKMSSAFKRQQRAKTLIRVLKAGGEQPTHQLVFRSRLLYSPVPASLKGRVKELGRTRERLQRCQELAAKCRKQLEKEVI